MSVIESEGLRKDFKTRRGTVEAVRGVDLAVESGEVFGFLGPNGAGKTTTVRMLATLLPPSGGRATIAGHDLVREPRRVRERIGYVSQAGGVDPSATGRQNLLLQGRLCGLDRVQTQSRAEALLAALELNEVANRAASTYSGGQRRRLALALGLIHQPDVLFLDEPTVGLDPQGRAHLWKEIGTLRESGATVFLTTHYLEEADALCDRLAIIDGGLIVAEGTPDALKHQVVGDVVMIRLRDPDLGMTGATELMRLEPFVREVRADDEFMRVYVEHGEQALPMLLRVLDGAGHEVEAITLARPTLDDVFLRQTGRSIRETPGPVADETGDRWQ